ncbi:MAG: nucleotide sugar dehydrogenase [Clostridiaceae bacterium]|nr:nucleotide sugar dehydrogenase [Clostridiaceae bacterium]
MAEIRKICVVGVGYIGLPTCVVLAQAGYQVYGADINEKIISSLESGVVPIDEPGLQEEYDAARERLHFSVKPEEADAFYICVSTPLDMTGAEPRAKLDYVFSAASAIAKVLRPGNLVILESSVPPKTTRRVAELLAQESGLAADAFYAVHCPERVIPGQMLRELRENDRLIGSPTEEGARLAKTIYDRILTKGSVRVTDDVTAETAKLAENAFRDVNIAYANELSVIAAGLGIDVFEVIELANCHPRVNINTPGIGVGGHCIPVVPWFLCEQFPDDTALMHAARAVNDHKPVWAADRVGEIVAPPADICVLGMTYKPDVDDLRDSASVDFAMLLASRGYHVTVCEPNVKAETICGLANVTLEDALKTGFVVVSLAHKEFRENRERIAKVPHYDAVGLLCDVK